MIVETTYGDNPKLRNIWEKSWRTWSKIHDQYLDRADFFLKVDSDSYLGVENLRAFLQYFDPNEPHYLGHTHFARHYTCFFSIYADQSSSLTLS